MTGSDVPLPAARRRMIPYRFYVRKSGVKGCTFAGQKKGSLDACPARPKTPLNAPKTPLNAPRQPGRAQGIRMEMLQSPPPQTTACFHVCRLVQSLAMHRCIGCHPRKIASSHSPRGLWWVDDVISAMAYSRDCMQKSGVVGKNGLVAVGNV